MKKAWSEILGLPVVGTSNNHPFGQLNGVFIHPETGQVLAFMVGLTKVLSPQDIQKWEKTSVRLKSLDALVSPQEILRLNQFGVKRCLINQKRVRSKRGKYMGRVSDLIIDTSVDSLLQIEVSKGFLWWRWTKRVIGFEHIQEITDSTVILAVEPEDTASVKALTKTTDKKTAAAVA